MAREPSSWKLLILSLVSAVGPRRESLEEVVNRGLDIGVGLGHGLHPLYGVAEAERRELAVTTDVVR